MLRNYRHRVLHADAVFFHRADFHVVDISGRQNEVRFLPGLAGMRVVVDRHFPLAHDLESIFVNDDRRSL